MNKAELVAALLEQNKDFGSKAKVESFVNSFVGVVSDEVAKGGEVALIGFGTFKSTKRAARAGRNPQTGKTIKIAAKTAPVFKAGKAFKDKVNATGTKKKKK